MCASKECVFYCFWINVLHICINSVWFNASFQASDSLLIFCLDDLPIDVSEVLKSTTVIVLLSIFPFMFVNICFMCLGAPILGAYIFTIIISSCWTCCQTQVYVPNAEWGQTNRSGV